MAYNSNKDLKLYYSIGEVARMFNVNESLLRYWEKEFPMISPKKAGGNIRQYRKEDIENIRLVYHLVKEKGMTLQGAKQRLKVNKEKTVQTSEVVSRLKEIREELVKLRKSLDYLTWNKTDREIPLLGMNGVSFFRLTNTPITNLARMSNLLERLT